MIFLREAVHELRVPPGNVAGLVPTTEATQAGRLGPLRQRHPREVAERDLEASREVLARSQDRGMVVDAIGERDVSVPAAGEDGRRAIDEARASLRVDEAAQPAARRAWR